MGWPNPSRETKLLAANGDREIFIFPVQLTTSNIGNLTPVDPYSAMSDDIHVVAVNTAARKHVMECGWALP